MKSFLYITAILILSLSFGVRAIGADPEQYMIKDISLILNYEPSAPPPVMEHLFRMIDDTLRDVLIEQTGGVASFKLHSEQVTIAIMEGLNVVLEPKGFIVRNINLEFDTVTRARVDIIPAGGVDGGLGPVVDDVEIIFSADEVPDFWHPLLKTRLDSMREKVVAHYSEFLIGLPLAFSDPGFITSIIEPYLKDSTFIDDSFPEFSVTCDYELGPTAHVIVSLGKPVDPIHRLRVRMSGDTIPNVVLDALRDAITSNSDVVVDMPRALVMSNVEEIGEFFATEVENDDAGGVFDPIADVRFRFEEKDNSLIAYCNVRSRTFDLNLRAYIDFGLEDSDSGEVEGRVGYFIGRDFEVMMVFNLFTNDMTLEPDALLGWRPADGSFFAGGYDLEAKDHKFFATQRIWESIFCEAEVFAESDRSQYGLTYRFHQYFSGGVYAMGGDEYWFRATFRL